MLQPMILPVALVLMCLQVSFLVVAQENCPPGGIVEIVETGNCAKRYRYRQCSNDPWVDAMCVGGYINGTKRKCQPFGTNCPNTDVTDRLLSRQKRQAEQNAPDCTRTYRCPQNLTELFIYPDWSNTNCDTYVMCLSGRLIVESCTEFGYKYYNPRRLSCEATATPTNTCVFRMTTDLSPILK